MLKIIKSYMMPIAMVLGISFYRFFSQFAGIIPYFIFLMLLLTYSKIDIKKIRPGKMHLWLILIQIFGSLLVYIALNPINHILAQGASICVLAPTATSAPVIVRMLKGNVENLTAYSLISNLVVIVLAPVFFSFIGQSEEISFIESFVSIFRNVALLLLLPLVIAVILRKFTPKIAVKVSGFGFLSFYLWAIALIVVIAKTVLFITQQDDSNYAVFAYLAAASLFICILQFTIGRRIGKEYGETVAGGQGLGQKNTVLVIWMAQTYLNPLSSIGPGAYVIWQNTINSYQVWLQNYKSRKK